MCDCLLGIVSLILPGCEALTPTGRLLGTQGIADSSRLKAAPGSPAGGWGSVFCRRHSGGQTLARGAPRREAGLMVAIAFLIAGPHACVCVCVEQSIMLIGTRYWRVLQGTLRLLEGNCTEMAVVDSGGS